MFWIVAVVALVIFIIVLLILPAPLASRLGGVAIIFGLFITVYQLYQANRKECAELKRIDLKYSNKYYDGLINTFMNHSSSLKDLYREIYGSSISVEEHGLMHLFVSYVESLIETSYIPDEINKRICKWLASNKFMLFWSQNKFEFRKKTRDYIDSFACHF